MSKAFVAIGGVVIVAVLMGLSSAQGPVVLNNSAREIRMVTETANTWPDAARYYCWRDGVHDDTACVTHLIETAQVGGVVRFMAGMYAINTLSDTNNTFHGIK